MAAAVCFSSAVVALSWAWADLSVTAASKLFERRDHSPEDLSRKLYRLEQARTLHVLNADYASEIARHQNWLAWRSQGVAHVSVGHRDLAIKNYREAVRLRPTWGFAWVNLAESKMLAGQNDSETTYALGRALELAPFELATQRKALLVGFSLWGHLSENLRDALRMTLRRAVRLENRVDEIIRLAIQTGRAEEIVELLKKKQHRDLYARLLARHERP